MARDDVLLQAPPGSVKLVSGDESFDVDAEGLVAVPMHVAAAVLSSPVHGYKRAVEKPVKGEKFTK